MSKHKSPRYKIWLIVEDLYTSKDVDDVDLLRGMAYCANLREVRETLDRIAAESCEIVGVRP